MKFLIISALICAASASWLGHGGYGGGYGGYGGYGGGYGGYGLGAYGYGKAVVVKKVVAAPAPDPVGPPAPYEMGYDIVDADGNRNGRKESGDAAGNKAGSYSLALADGRRRHVTYKADGAGFRAVVTSNEPGTDASQDPADVDRQGAPAPVVKKVVVAAPSYGYAGLGYGYGGLGYGAGIGHGYGYGLGGSRSYNRRHLGAYRYGRGLGGYGGYGRGLGGYGGYGRGLGGYGGYGHGW